MRIFPVVLSIVIAALLYAFVIERDWLFAQFQGPPGAEETESVAQTDPSADDDGVTDDGIIKVVVQKSRAEVVDTAVILRGQTEAIRQVDVRSETSATVVSDPLRKGSYIEAGQEMCTLDPGTRGASLAEAKARLSEAKARRAEAESRVPEAAARVAEAEARLEEAMTNENAAVRLSDSGFASETRVKNTQAAMFAAKAGVEAAVSGLSTAQSGIESADAWIESAEAGVAAAEKEIERLVIKAPFAGYLESDTAELGALLQPGGLCATIIQLDPIKLVAFVPETEVDKVALGALAGGQLAGSGAQIGGTVSFLSRSADPTTRTFRVEINVPNPDLAIRDGQTAEILIASAGEAAHLLPASAMTLNDEGTLGVRVVGEDNLVDFKPVTILNDTPSGVWLGGLGESASVIVVGQEYVTKGVEVAPTFQEPKS